MLDCIRHFSSILRQSILDNPLQNLDFAYFSKSAPIDPKNILFTARSPFDLLVTRIWVRYRP
ncbi:hypothetical protein VCHA40P240_120029 [Vibrio chagasii]|nr:hypothetical protein VCHA40P240_120029 [Vibrio chagasii]